MAGHSRKKVDLSGYSDSLINLEEYKARKTGMVESFATDRETASRIRDAELALKELPDNYHIVNSEKKLKYLADQIRLHKEFIFDCETSGLDAWRDKLYCVSFWVGEQGYVIPIEHQLMSCLSPTMVRANLADVFKDHKIDRMNHNCFSGDTELLTKEFGTITFKEVEGKEVTVLDMNGNWVRTTVRNYGIQETHEVYFSLKRNHVVKVRATTNHQWILTTGNRTVTSKLRKRHSANGDRDEIRCVTSPKPTSADPEYMQGVRHGIVFGDGTRDTSNKTSYWVRLCQDKALDLLPYFEELPVSYPKSNGGDPTVFLSQYKNHHTLDLKDLPPNTASDPYVLGFIRGWLATDGSVSKSGQITITSINKAYIEWLSTHAPKLGYLLHSSYSSVSKSGFGGPCKFFGVTFNSCSLTVEDLLRTKHKVNFVPTYENFKFMKVDKSSSRYEEVFCVEVPETRSFVLNYGLLTGNCKFDAHFVRQQLGMPVGRLYCDTLVQSQVINPDTNTSHGLKELSAQYGIASDTGNYKAQFGKTAWSYLPWKLGCYYAIKDCELVARLKEVQDGILAEPDKEKLLNLFWNIEMPMVNLTFMMETKGMRVDQHYLNNTLIPTVYQEWTKASETLRPYVEPYLGYVDGESVQKVLESPTKLEKIFFDKLDVPLIKFVTLRKDEVGKFTKRSLDKEAIAGTQRTCEVMRLLGEYRKWATVKKMFADTLPEKIVDGHVHPIMNVIGAATGRMSLSNPNLQQIPARMGPLVRNMFVPAPGNTFLSCDFSGQEVRILAHYSKDQKLVNFYKNPNGLDIYSQTALDAFDDIAFQKSNTSKKAFLKMSKADRKNINVYRDAKSLVLGLNYGMGPAKYSRNTGKSAKEGKQDFEAYHRAYPRVGVYQRAAIEFARENGYITTLLGRRRPLPFINSTSDNGLRSSAERAATNTCIQGSAADMVKIAAINVGRLIFKNKWPIQIVLLVHDEILYELPIEWAQQHPEAIQEITKTMCSALPLIVPMESSITWEPRWGSERELDEIEDWIADES